MALDLRAMEDIATAPASPSERLAGRWVALLTIVVSFALLPFAQMRLPEVAALVPAVSGVAVFSDALTALFLYGQYRLARNSQLAVLASAFGASAFLTLCFILTFPRVFSPTGLLHANLQTAPWIGTGETIAFALLVIVFALADARVLRWPGRIVAGIAAATALVSVTIVALAVMAPLPALLDDGQRLTGANGILSSVLIALEIVALLLLIASGRRTVTQVWLVVVMVVRIVLQIQGRAASGRYTIGWYETRFLSLLGATVLLAVFLVKINDLLLRLTWRTRALSERTEVAEIEIAESELRYRTLANVVPQLIWSATADGAIDYVNDRWIDYTGLDVDATRRAGWQAAIDPSQTPRDESWQDSLRTGEPFVAEFGLRHAASGRMRWFLINAIAVRDKGDEITRWIGSCTDIDDQKRIEEREAFLALAGDRLTSSLDRTATLDAITNLALVRLGVWVRVDLVGEDGELTIAAVASSRRDDDVALRPMVGRRSDGRFVAVLMSALAHREVIYHDGVRAFGSDFQRAPADAALLVPLTSGDVVLGALTIVRSDPDPPTLDEIALARDFGRRAAQALLHARLYERERSTADELQRAMLPQVMPQLPHVDFSASYSAASESQRVGGDFYDAFVLPDGRVALTIGDVTGHGLEAAVIMGEIRQALRAASFERAEPSMILDRASRLLVASGRTLFATAIFGVLDLGTGRFDYATAGHPAPLIFDGERVQRLVTSGLPIGLRDDEGVDFAVYLPSPCTLVLYTDGLLEFSRDLGDGERRIERAIRELGNEQIDHLAAAIMKRVLGDDEPTDDIAILTATVDAFTAAPSREAHEWRFRSSDARTATLVRHEIGALVAVWTGDEERRYESELVFGELFSNVVRHAPGPLVVTLAATAGGAALTVTDEGPGFSGRRTPGDTMAESGRGLHLVEALGDEVTIDGSSGGTRITVAFQRAAAKSAGANAALSSA